MKALIVEDESAAAQNLKNILREMHPPIEIVAVLESVMESVDFLRSSASKVDLIFMDIHLADGDAFKIFDRIEVSTPIIFTTAYDQYALQAFKVNSIDYILKPINSEEVERALGKLKLLSTSETQSYNERLKSIAQGRCEVAGSFLIHIKDKIIPLKVEEVAYFYTSNERVVATTHTQECYPMDKSLDAIFSMLSSSDFFRANRQFIISRSAVKDVSVWFGSRLALNLKHETPERIIIPKAKISEFKEWLCTQN